MTQNELAEALGISKGQCSKLAARGMPTHSLEAARAWRRRNLDPAWSKPTERPPSDEMDNPIDAVVFGVLPRLFFDPDQITTAVRAAELEADEDGIVRLAAALAGVYGDVLVRLMGFPERPLNLPEEIR